MFRRFGFQFEGRAAEFGLGRDTKFDAEEEEEEDCERKEKHGDIASARAC